MHPNRHRPTPRLLQLLRHLPREFHVASHAIGRLARFCLIRGKLLPNGEPSEAGIKRERDRPALFSQRQYLQYKEQPAQSRLIVHEGTGLKQISRAEL